LLTSVGVGSATRRLPDTPDSAGSGRGQCRVCRVLSGKLPDTP
jgi:hypothetical protein